MSEIEIDNDPDPITHSYDVFVKPHISSDRQIYVLQFPNRDSKQHYSQAHGALPLKMRVKPNAGMVEMDVPMDAWNNYDVSKGMKWGEAVKKSTANKGAGSHGLPGGFGIGGGQARSRGGRSIEDNTVSQEEIMRDYERAVKQEQVLVKQTLGGQAVPVTETTPQYMVGTFRGDQLHLIPVENIVQMRPQFHHIDAQTELERISKAKESSFAGAPREARAVHMTIKTNIDGEEESGNSMAERISIAQAEPWKHHRYIDENHDDAWALYDEMSVGKELKQDERLEMMPKLKSCLDDGEYLDLISGPRDAARLSRSKKKKEKKVRQDAVIVDGDADAEAGGDSSSTLSDLSEEDEPRT